MRAKTNRIAATDATAKRTRGLLVIVAILITSAEQDCRTASKENALA